MKHHAKVLIIDDDPDVLFTARAILRKHFEQVETLENPELILKTIGPRTPEVILLDMNFKTGATTGQEGLFWLREIIKHAPDAHVVMNTAYGEIELAVECMKEGAIDFLVKPWEKEKLLSTISAVYELQKSKREVNRLKHTEQILSKDLNSEFEELISESQTMRPILNTLAKVAKTDASVLILGENGTGKELIARALHQQSLRSGKSFIKVDLGSISKTLFESELFGYEKGAFTDAREDRPGRFEVADQGTLFLDEIGNLDQDLQAKLLTALQTGEIHRVGASQSTKIDIRLVSATNSPIHELVDSGQFRMDLLYRINTVIIEIPPLRDRKEDIKLLGNHFLRKYAAKYGKTGLSLSDKTIAGMEKYPWPGNVRELRNVIERAVILSEGKKLDISQLVVARGKPGDANSKSLNVEDREKEAILKALAQTEGKLAEAAKKLGIGRTTLYRKIKKYSL